MVRQRPQAAGSAGAGDRGGISGGPQEALLDETDKIDCPCGFDLGMGGKCLRCGLDQSRTEAWEDEAE
jgi:hypothetical protein